MKAGRPHTKTILAPWIERVGERCIAPDDDACVRECPKEFNHFYSQIFYEKPVHTAQCRIGTLSGQPAALTVGASGTRTGMRWCLVRRTWLSPKPEKQRSGSVTHISGL